MKGFLLDTNCISELVRLNPEKRVLQWIESVDEESLYLSVLTLGEIRKGLESLPRVKRRDALEKWLVELRMRFGDRLLPVEEAVADEWGRLAVQCKRAGRALATIDGLLAATALNHNLIIATRNVADFTIGQVSVFDPWNW